MSQRYDDWHWWCATVGGRNIAFSEFERLPAAAQGELLSLMEAWLLGNTASKEVGSLGQGLLELRYRSGNNHFRVLFYIDGRVSVAVHCFYKNQQKCPKKDLDLARSRKRSGAHVAIE